MLATLCAGGQTLPQPPVSSTAVTQSVSQTLVTGISNQAVAVSQSMLLSNRAVLIVSEARGLDVNAVKLKFSESMSGRFEIPLEGAKDIHREAEMLSKDFGASIAVIVDEATADGRLRTNYVFRNGVMPLTVAPVRNIGLSPGGRRMYVWPETSKLSAPRDLRLVQQPN